MPDLRRTLHVVSRRLPEGLWLAEAMHVPECSRLGVDRRSLAREVVRAATAVLAELPPAEAWQRHGGGPPECRSVTVTWTGTPGHPSDGDAIHLTLPAAVLCHGDHDWRAWVPALGLFVGAATSAKLDRLLTLEAGRALQRLGITGDLLRMARLARVAESAVDSVQRPVPMHSAIEHHRTLERRARQMGGANAVLPGVAAPVLPRRCREAYELDSLVESAARALAGPEAASVLLIGPSGAGKSAALRELVRRSRTLLPAVREFWETSGSRLVAGAGGFGSLQERILRVVAELRERHAVLLLGNLFELLQVGRARAGMDGAAAVLLPQLTSGQLLALAECTAEQAEWIEREDPRLLGAFTRINVAEPDEARTRRILERTVEHVTSHQPAVIDPAAVDSILSLHRRYAGISAFPGKALLFLESLLAEGGSQALIGEDEVVSAFAEQSGLPRFLIDDALTLDLAAATAFFRERIQGQPEAAATVVDLIVSLKAGLSREQRPLASLFFVGPTGVGKTETAKAIAEYFFRDRSRLTRFDMSEFATGAAARRLVGGAGNPEGLLTARIREQPFQVLLLDEVEKADAQVFDLLLQALGEARLTDAVGRTADLRNTVVILTSNLGADTWRQGRTGFHHGPGSGRDHFLESVRGHFRPELFNRIDRIVPFLPLGQDALRAVAERELTALRRRPGVVDRPHALTVAPAAVDRLVAIGTDEHYGARPLKRAIEQHVVEPLAERLNAFSWHQPVAATIAVATPDAPLAVEVRGDGPRTDAAPRGTSAHELAGLARVRRRLQAFREHALCVRLEEELPALQRLQDQMLRPRRGSTPPVDAAQRLARLRPMTSALDALRDFTATVEQAEEHRVLSLLGLTTLSDSQSLSAAQAEARLRITLLDLIALEQDAPHQLTLVIAGESLLALPMLVAGYAQAARALGAERISLHFYVPRRAGSTGYSVQPAPPELDPAALVDGRRERHGAILSIHLPHARSLFADECGVHVFLRGKDVAGCRVSLLDDLNAAVTTLPEGLGRNPNAPRAERRREYQLDARMARDQRLGAEVPFQRTELGALILRGIEGSLRLRLLELAPE